MALTIPVAHDFICPWCWVGLKQVLKLQEEFGVGFEWLGYELFPKDLAWNDYPPVHHPTNKPPTPSRFDFLLVADDVDLPRVDRPQKMRTYNAHEAVEYAKTEGVAGPFVEALYRAYWEQGRNINDLATLQQIASAYVRDVSAMVRAIETEAFRDKIGKFDDPAHAEGIYNVPTFFIGGKRYAEQPFVVLRNVVKRAIEEHCGIDAYYNLEFPHAPENRPYTFINMVSTIDGKTVSGTRFESVSDLGSRVDRLLMKRLERNADAVMVGARTLRATSPAWDPLAPKRIVVTRSGDLPRESCFMMGGEAFVATSGSANLSVPHGSKLIRAGSEELDFKLLLARLRSGFGIQKLLVMGGSELNAQLLRAGLVDELFLTISPKLKLGRGLPTYADGEPLTRDQLQRYSLVEHHVVGDEIFLRYRTDRGHHR